MFNNEWLDKNVFTVRKCKVRDDINTEDRGKELVGLVLPYYLKECVSTDKIRLVLLKGGIWTVNLSVFESIKPTRIMDANMRNAIDEVVKSAREWNKCNMYLRRGTRGYNIERLKKATDDLNSSIRKMNSVYGVAYKDEIEKQNKAKELELKKQKALADKEAKAKARELAKKQKLEAEAKKQVMKNYVKTPKFVGGGFVVLNGFEENAVEYDSDTTYDVTLHIKSDAALKRVQKIYRFATPTRTYRTTNGYGAKYEVVLKRLNNRDYFDILSLFGHTEYLKDSLSVSYQNHYSDEDWWYTIKIPSFTYNKNGEEEYNYFGSCADRGESFTEYVEDLKKNAKWIR